jgi:type IV pilus assembly protein PilM
MGIRTWGLEFGSSGIKMVELTKTWRGERVTNYGFFPTPAREKEERQREQIQRMNEMLTRGGKGEDEVILAAGSHQTMVHRIALPFAERKKNLRIIKFEMEPLLPLPIDQVVVDFFPLGKGTNGREALTFAVPKEVLRDQMALLREGGLDPETILPEALALYRAVRHFQVHSRDGAAALLDIGHEKTTMIIWRRDTLELTRSIAVAGASLNRALKRSLNLAIEEAAALKEKGGGEEGKQAIRETLLRLAEEVRRTLTAYESGGEGRSIQKVLLTGGSATLPGIQDILEEELNKPVAPLDLAGEDPSRLGDIPRQIHPILTVALGAALWGAYPQQVNFRQEEFAPRKKAQRTKTRKNLLIAYGVILGGLGTAIWASNLYWQEQRFQDLKSEIRKEFMQAQPGVRKVVNEIQQMKVLVRDERAKVDALGGLSGTRSPLELIRELSLLIEPNMRVRVTEIVLDPESVEVSGEADSFETVNRIKAKLDQSSFFKQVELKTARASSLENVFEFKFQMKRGS